MNHSMLLIVTAALTAKGPKPGDWSFGWLGVASIAEVGLAIIISLWMISNYYSAEQEQTSHSPWQLFADLCLAHKLSRRERKLLKRLAYQHGLDQPAMLFVEPSWFRPEKVGPKWSRLADELDQLKQRLFATH